MPKKIPHPPGMPLIGNILDVQDEVPIRALENLADVYGPIYTLRLRNKDRVFIGDHALLDEVCDEKRFWKTTGQALSSLNEDAKARGLFTAPSEADPDWAQAHRTLLPAFGPLAIQEMFDEMYDIASQLVMKWARKGPEYRIPVTDDFTRLTLDTIALCAMDYRFNSFYQDEMHPFVKSMNNTLQAQSNANKLPNLIHDLILGPKDDVKADDQYMNQVAAELVQHRRDHPTEKKDLLNAMINGKDPKTGEKMRDALIISNMITFLIAGHETTSGLLSFAFLELLKNPETYYKAQKEVDQVVGKKKIKVGQLQKLKYLNAVLRETLRLHPTAPAFSRSVRPDNKEDPVTVGNGEYTVDREVQFTCLIGKAQRDPKVYGEDANEFKPDRMLDENFEKLPNNAWKPFGTGVRACIGRAFAWQEALLVMAVLLQNFNLRLDDAKYELRIKQALTIKPKDFYMRAALRDELSATSLLNDMSKGTGSQHEFSLSRSNTNELAAKATQTMTVLYGSNSGTCQSLAQKMMSAAARRGFKATVQDLDSAVHEVPQGEPVIIICASYDGQPTDNARQFIAWLESLGDDRKTFDGVTYAVFGCGHSDWQRTYQRIPTLVSDTMEKYGGKKMTERGSANVAKGNVFEDFQGWCEGSLWPAIGSNYKVEAPKSTDGSTGIDSGEVDVEVLTHARSKSLRQDVRLAKVLSASKLTAPGTPEKRHLEVQLPSEMTFECGDYLAILPLNPDDNVQRACAKYDLPWDAQIKIKAGESLTLPNNTVLSAFDLFRGYVELSVPATKQDIRTCLKYSTDPNTRRHLLSLLGDNFDREVTAKRVSLLDLLEEYQSIQLPLGSFLTMLPPMRPRHYSISSSPLYSPTSCTITYSVIDTEAYSGHGRFRGVAGSYLSTLKQGDTIHVAIRATNKLFRLPSDIENTSLMMFCAGTGLAPFRGFLQERATQMRFSNRKLAPAILFVGCRSPKGDRLYPDEMDAWIAEGVVDVRYAFSRDPASSEGCKYVQDRMLHDKEDIKKYWEAGAKIYVCGSPEVMEGVGKSGRKIVLEEHKQKGDEWTEKDVEEWFEKRKNERFVTDVFR